MLLLLFAALLKAKNQSSQEPGISHSRKHPFPHRMIQPLVAKLVISYLVFRPHGFLPIDVQR